MKLDISDYFLMLMLCTLRDIKINTKEFYGTETSLYCLINPMKALISANIFLTKYITIY